MSPASDIVKWQIRIAAGVELDCTQDDIKVRGAAIECRINAGGVGKVDFLHIPSGPWVRFDTFLYQGYEVPPFYDSMLGKMIVFSSTREEAIRKMQSAPVRACHRRSAEQHRETRSISSAIPFSKAGLLYRLHQNREG